MLSQMYTSLHVKYPLFVSVKKNIEFSRQTSEKILKYEILRKSGRCEPICYMRTDGRTDGQSDRRDVDSSRFSQFCERA
jgi:hypothetical protein